MKVYRNIFFHTSSIQAGTGRDVQYYGRIFNDALHIKDLSSMYDKSLDLYITCSTCAKKQYGKFIKVKK